jgi:hypothetical protein
MTNETWIKFSQEEKKLDAGGLVAVHFFGLGIYVKEKKNIWNNFNKK